jgi:hypothetical protein
MFGRIGGSCIFAGGVARLSSSNAIAVSAVSGQGTFILSFLVNWSNDFKKTLLIVIVE